MILRITKHVEFGEQKITKTAEAEVSNEAATQFGCIEHLTRELFNGMGQPPVTQPKPTKTLS